MSLLFIFFPLLLVAQSLLMPNQGSFQFPLGISHFSIKTSVQVFLTIVQFLCPLLNLNLGSILQQNFLTYRSSSTLAMISQNVSNYAHESILTRLSSTHKGSQCHKFYNSGLDIWIQQNTHHNTEIAEKIILETMGLKIHDYYNTKF